MRPRVPMQHDRAEFRTPPRRPHPTAGSPGVSVERIAALQRAAGNAAVLRLLAEARHAHGAGRGHQPSTPVQRSSVPDVLRTPERPVDDAVRGDMEQGPVAGTDDGTGLRISDPCDRFEREAEANAARALRSGAVGPDGARPAATEPPRRAGLAHSVQRVPDEAGGSQGGGLADMFKASLGVFRLRSDATAPQPSRKMAVSHIAKVLADSGQEGEETVGSGVMTSIGAIEALAGENGARDIHTVFTRPELSELYRIPANDPRAATAHRAIAEQELAYWRSQHAAKPSVGTGVAINVDAATRVRLQKTLGSALQWSEAFRKAAAQAGNQFE